MCSGSFGEYNQVLTHLQHLGHTQDGILQILVLHQDDIVMTGHPLQWVALYVLLGGVVVGVTQRCCAQSGYADVAVQGALMVGGNDKLPL